MEKKSELIVTYRLYKYAKHKTVNHAELLDNEGNTRKSEAKSNNKFLKCYMRSEPTLEDVPM